MTYVVDPPLNPNKQTKQCSDESPFDLCWRICFFFASNADEQMCTEYKYLQSVKYKLRTMRFSILSLRSIKNTRADSYRHCTNATLPISSRSSRSRQYTLYEAAAMGEGEGGSEVTRSRLLSNYIRDLLARGLAHLLL